MTKIKCPTACSYVHFVKYKASAIISASRAIKVSVRPTSYAKNLQAVRGGTLGRCYPRIVLGEFDTPKVTPNLNPWGRHGEHRARIERDYAVRATDYEKHSARLENLRSRCRASRNARCCNSECRLKQPDFGSDGSHRVDRSSCSPDSLS